MLIYILHKQKYYTFRLPKKVSGEFIISDFSDLDGSKRNLVNVQALDGRWIISSNSEISLHSNEQSDNPFNIVDSIELKEYNFYTLGTLQGEEVILYVAPGYDATFISRKYAGNKPIVIGSGNSCNLRYSNERISAKQVSLTYNGDKWTIANLNNKVSVYVNGRSIETATLDTFESVFIEGLNIAVCGDIVFMNNPLNQVSIDTSILQEYQEIFAWSSEDNGKPSLDFYNESDYFFKSPVFLKQFKTLNLMISNPEEKEQKSDSSLLMSMIPSALMSLTTVLYAFFAIRGYSSGQTSKESLITTVAMAGVMLFVSVLWPFVQDKVENIKRRLKNYRNSKIYKKYLNEKKKTLEDAMKGQKSTLDFNNLSLIECQNTIYSKSSYLFSSSIEQPNFLRVRLGTGKILLDCKIDYSKPDFIKYDNPLLDKVDKLIEDHKYIEDAPFSFSLKRSAAFINSKKFYDDYLESLIIQLITFYDYYNLKLVILTSEDSKLNLIKNLNHCWDNEREFRYFAVTLQEGETISSNLMQIYNHRTSQENKNQLAIPHYLIISDNITRFKNLKIIDKILKNPDAPGFSLVAFAGKLTEVPNAISYFIDYNEREATLFQAAMVEDNINTFKPELVDESVNFLNCVRTVGNIPIHLLDEKGGILPNQYNFLEMLNVGNVNQLNSVNRWRNSQIVNSLATPVGVDAAGNSLILDLHEKKHGPHGLIAGMTGSGKSEFIITYILSMAVNYSPYEVQFVLIDYKGGGLAGAFENRKTGIKLPHLVGTITNLDKASMNRTLVSIKSEMQRRQRVFNEAKETLNSGTIDIYKYQRLVREGTLKEPMAHLFIICDEFAELKAQQPDFMDELVSAARIGRSLGVHLILATQKPSGVVDDQIWSNAKFRLCCRVQTTEDSKEMLKKDDAAYLKQAGRFFLQVGYDEVYIQGQSAYSGSKYKPSDTVNLINDSEHTIEFLDNLGNVIKTTKTNDASANVEKDLGTELDNVLKYLISCAAEIGFKNQQLWLDTIPEKLYLYDLYKKYPMTTQPFVINPLIGEYDEPENQLQGPVHINLTKDGNLWISGMTGSGKTTLLSTLIYSSIVNHRTEELNIYIVDLITESLRMFINAPQVGDFITSSEPDKVRRLFYFLINELSRRRQYFATHGGTFASEVAKGAAPFPNILVVINGIDVLIEQFNDLYDNVIIPLFRECHRAGITIVMTSTGMVVSYITDSFSNKIALKNADGDYSHAFVTTRGIVPATNPGHGLVQLNQVYEFQTSLIFPDENFDYNLQYIMGELNKALKKAPALPIMPKIVSLDSLAGNAIQFNLVPIGISLKSNCVYSYDFSEQINLVLYANEKMATSFMISLAQIYSFLNNIKIFIIDSIGTENALDMNIPNTQIFTSNFKNLMASINSSINDKKNSQDFTQQVLFLIGNYEKIERHLEKLKKEDSSVVTLDEVLMNAEGMDCFKFIAFDQTDLKTLDHRAWSDFYNERNGIILSTEVENQDIVNADNDYSDEKVTKDIATVVYRGKKNLIKFVRARRDL